MCFDSKEAIQDVFKNEIDTTDQPQAIDSFENMMLKPELLRGIHEACGFESPSDVQQRAIIPIIKGRDVIVRTRAGTGKTTVFSISILQQQLDTSIKNTQALVLAPTREVAQRIHRIFASLGNYTNIECYACVGGTKVREDISKLREGVHVVIGTPGRVYDMIRRGALKMDNIRVFCLDEADEISSRGFNDQLHEIFQLLPQGTQVVSFSPTMPVDLLEIIQKFMINPIRIFENC